MTFVTSGFPNRHHVAAPFTIETDWEVLQQGAPEVRACFAAIGIGQHDIWLTEAEDKFVNRVRHKVHLSAYRLAEWLAWNWWRLRWEPRKRAAEWALAHRMTTIGGGFVWPTVAMFSDGERVALLARPTMSRPTEPFRSVSDAVMVVPAPSFEDTIDRFIAQVLGQLREEAIADTNLERVWQDVRAERADPQLAFRRRLEALLSRSRTWRMIRICWTGSFRMQERWGVPAPWNWLPTMHRVRL